jgi:hypothetical protein
MLSAPRPLLLRELALAILLVAASLAPRLRDVGGPFDREFEGQQGAFFAIAAINYERLGFGAHGGYPVLNIDLPRERGSDGELRDRSDAWYTYANHPPLVPWIAWAGFKLFGPAEWNERYGARGVEHAVRMPFLALQVAFLAAFFWALREAYGSTTALAGLAFACFAPVVAFYAPLVNYENPALLAIALGAGYYVRFARTRARGDRLRLGFAFAFGSCITYAPLFFFAALFVHALFALGRRMALELALGPGLMALAPIAAHTAWSRWALAEIGQAPEGILSRARTLLEPLTSGEHPIGEWSRLQVERIAYWYTLPLALVALAGFAVALARLRKPVSHRPLPIAEILLAGGVLSLFAFYRHTLDPEHPFLLLVAPAICAFAAIALGALEPLVANVPGRRAWIALATAAVCTPCVMRFAELRHRYRANATEAAASARPKPELPLPDEIGHELRALIPEGTFAIYPDALGLNYAVYYYAWRTLWPIRDARDTLPIAVAERYLPGAPRMLVLPKEPPPSAKSAVDALHSELAQGAPLRSSAHYDAWGLP